MKIVKSNPINCHIWREGGHRSEPKNAWKVMQDVLPCYDFYVTEANYSINGIEYNGYNLTEFSTGMSFSGHYPDKTKPGAARWLTGRIEQYGVERLTEIINTNVEKYGRLNIK